MMGVKYGPLAAAALMAIVAASVGAGMASAPFRGSNLGGAVFVPKRGKLKRRRKTIKGHRK